MAQVYKDCLCMRRGNLGENAAGFCGGRETLDSGDACADEKPESWPPSAPGVEGGDLAPRVAVHTEANSPATGGEEETTEEAEDEELARDEEIAAGAGGGTSAGRKSISRVNVS